MKNRQADEVATSLPSVCSSTVLLDLTPVLNKNATREIGFWQKSKKKRLSNEGMIRNSAVEKYLQTLGGPRPTDLC